MDNEDNKPTVNPDTEDSNVIKLIPKKDVEHNEILKKNEEIFIRRQRCVFKKNYVPGGCNCNYCVYFNMMGQRVFEMIRYDMVTQSQKGEMNFVSSDIVDILQIALEKVMKFEEAGKNSKK